MGIASVERILYWMRIEDSTEKFIVCRLGLRFRAVLKVAQCQLSFGPESCVGIFVCVWLEGRDI